jgi:hypothetical protein
MLTNLPKEFYIPPKTEVIFVQDFFAKDLTGGAELTSDAIVKACPRPLFELHAHSITENMIQKHHGKIWVFGNQTMVPPHLLQRFIDLKVRYYFFEYDFKPCVMRSTKKHELQAGKCGCETTPYGKFMANWMTKATQAEARYTDRMNRERLGSELRSAMRQFADMDRKVHDEIEKVNRNVAYMPSTI